MFMQFRRGAAIAAPAVLAVAALCIQCPGAFAQTALKLSIGTAAGIQGETVEVPIMLSGGSNASTIVFGIGYDAQALQLLSLKDGAALRWDQYVIWWATPGAVPATVWGNNNTIANGELCVVAFRILSSVPGVVEIYSSGKPSAASLMGTAVPVAVSSGEVYVNCDGFGPDTPTGVTASTDAAAGVTVSWNPAAGAFEYRVYRARTNTPDAVEAVSEWLAGATSWEDVTAAAPVDTVALGCQGGAQRSVRYYYWVRARTEAGCPSDYSQAAEGWRGSADKAAALSAGLIAPAPGDAVLFAVAALGLSAAAAARARIRRNRGE